MAPRKCKTDLLLIFCDDFVRKLFDSNVSVNKFAIERQKGVIRSHDFAMPAFLRIHFISNQI